MRSSGHPTAAIPSEHRVGAHGAVQVQPPVQNPHAYTYPAVHGSMAAVHVPAAHTVAYEAGGLSMMELATVMRADAEAQEKLIQILSEMLDETVKRNDSLQVRLQFVA
jgi:hypothetical protein